MRRLGLVALASLHGCFTAQRYACEDATQCVVDGAQGSCEAAGFCAFPDDACASGRRYSPFAGDGLARECVDGAGTTGEGTVATTPGSEVSSDAESSTGCATECAQGEWLWTVRDAELGVGQAHGLARAGTRVLVTGEQATELERTAAFVASYEAASGTRISTSAIASDDDSSGVGLALAASGEGGYVVVGREASTAGLRAFVARFDEDAQAWIRRHDTLQDDEYRGVGLAADGRAITAGRSGALAIVHAYDVEGVEVFARTIAAEPPASTAMLHTIAVAPGGTSWVAGAFGTGGEQSELWARRLQVDGGTAYELVQDDPASTPDVARAIAGLADGGFVVGGNVAGSGWLARVAADTTQTASVLDDGELLGLALAQDGSIVASGWTQGEGRDVWLAGFSAALDPTPIWQTSLDHAGLDDEAHAIAIGDDGIVIVVGFASDADGAAPWLGAWAPPS